MGGGVCVCVWGGGLPAPSAPSVGVRELSGGEPVLFWFHANVIFFSSL